jgi:D-alanine transaminase
MSRIAYVNGRYVAHRDAAVHIEDRGYQFSDGVYEVCEVRDSRLVDERRHMERLARSLDELRIPHPMTPKALSAVMHETMARNRVTNGIVYLQVTRGVARRDHAFPPAGTTPAIVVTARTIERWKGEREAANGVTVVSYPENRWTRPDIKSVSLLGNVLAKQFAKEKGAREAWYVDRDGFVTEGSSSNAWIVTTDGKVMTHGASNGILRGITRTVILDVLKAHNLTLDERPFTLEQAFAAGEAFVTAASQIVLPVISIDGRPVGNGKPGPIATALRRDFHHHAEFT